MEDESQAQTTQTNNNEQADNNTSNKKTFLSKWQFWAIVAGAGVATVFLIVFLLIGASSSTKAAKEKYDSKYSDFQSKRSSVILTNNEILNKYSDTDFAKYIQDSNITSKDYSEFMERFVNNCIKDNKLREIAQYERRTNLESKSSSEIEEYTKELEDYIAYLATASVNYGRCIDNSTDITQDIIKRIDEHKAEAKAKAEAEAKAKAEAEAKAKAEAEAKAKAEAEAKAKAEAEAKAKAEAEARQKEIDNATVSRQNALRKAESYLEYTSFSRKGLIKQLEYEKFSNADATWAVDHVAVDWNEQAAKKAASYLEYTAFSRSGLINQLKYEGFTQAQAEYGVKKVGL